jgi:hypothetical protein
MSRISYCREQARLCRDAAAQIGLDNDSARLRELARAYEAEANALEELREHQTKQAQEERRKKPQD